MKEIGNILMLTGLGMFTGRLIAIDTISGIFMAIFLLGFILWKSGLN